MKQIFLLVLLLCSGLKAAAQVCPLSGTDLAVYNWVPSKGSIPEYAAAIVASENATGFIILLGGTPNGVYTIEGGNNSDASLQRYANLVFTTFNGKRSTWKLPDMDLESSDNTDSLRQAVKVKTKGQLQQFQKRKIYTTASMKPVHYMQRRNSDEEVWVLEVKSKDKRRKLVWSFNAEPSMCWCFYSWNCVSQKITKP